MSEQPEKTVVKINSVRWSRNKTSPHSMYIFCTVKYMRYISQFILCVHTCAYVHAAQVGLGVGND